MLYEISTELKEIASELQGNALFETNLDKKNAYARSAFNRCYYSSMYEAHKFIRECKLTDTPDKIEHRKIIRLLSTLEGNIQKAISGNTRTSSSSNNVIDAVEVIKYVRKHLETTRRARNLADYEIYTTQIEYKEHSREVIIKCNIDRIKHNLSTQLENVEKIKKLLYLLSVIARDLGVV